LHERAALAAAAVAALLRWHAASDTPLVFGSADPAHIASNASACGCRGAPAPAAAPGPPRPPRPLPPPVQLALDALERNLRFPL